jgi:hypothetical protein
MLETILSIFNPMLEELGASEGLNWYACKSQTVVTYFSVVKIVKSNSFCNLQKNQKVTYNPYKFRKMTMFSFMAC